MDDSSSPLCCSMTLGTSATLLNGGGVTLLDSGGMMVLDGGGGGTMLLDTS